MLFPRREKVVNQYTGTAGLNSSIAFSLTREFFLDSLLLVVPVTVAGTITSNLTYTDGGLTNLIQRVQLGIADGSSNRNQTDCSGYGLIRHGAKVMNGLDVNTLSALGAPLNVNEAATAGSTAGTYFITVPLLFKNPQITDPVGSIFMLPLPRYNTNPTLTVNFGSLANAISTNHGATITIGTPHVVQIQRQVNVITFPTVETEIRELTQTISATGANQYFNLDVPGSYSALDIYTTNSSGVATDISSGPWILQFLGQSIRQFQLSDVKTQEQYSMGNDAYFSTTATGTGVTTMKDYFPGLYHLDFIHDGFGMEAAELGSLLNVNPLAGSGAVLQLNMSLGSTGSVSIVAERFFGDLSGYGLTYNPSGN